MNQDQRLFNNCPGFTQPDWSQFTSLELSGSIDRDGDSTANVAADVADFFTVYGHCRDEPGWFQPITDCQTALEALAVAAELATLSGFDVVVHPSLSKGR